MELMVLNSELDAIHIMDTYESFIWTDRYYSNGDFELHTSMQQEIVDYLHLDYYLHNRDSEHTMIIEKILISSDIEKGGVITITGRSLESILDRRIIWGQKMINGNLQNGIKDLLVENIINPSDVKRKIGNFIFEESDDVTITAITMDAQYMGENLYEVIQKICQEHDLGFKVTLNDNKQFIFKLYKGYDRSYDQIIRPYVIFSPDFDNIIDSNFVESRSSTKNVTLVGGEGEGSLRKYATVGDVVGLNRREIFTDAKDISSDVGNHKILTPTEYAAVLIQRGNEQLIERADVKSFDGKIEANIMYEYGVDFLIGDIVQIANEYGREGKVRIIELIMSENEAGSSIYPTYTTSK